MQFHGSLTVGGEPAVPGYQCYVPTPDFHVARGKDFEAADDAHPLALMFLCHCSPVTLPIIEYF